MWDEVCALVIDHLAQKYVILVSVSVINPGWSFELGSLANTFMSFKSCSLNIRVFSEIIVIMLIAVQLHFV